MQDITEILQELAVTAPIFHSEADFQLSLFRLLARNVGAENVCLESFEDKKYHIDILVSDQPIVAIEVKYSSKKVSGGFLRIGDECFRLKDQSARDLARFGFWVDVSRLEEFVNKRADENLNAIGYVIFLSNDEKYWDPALSTEGTNDEMFKIHEGRNVTEESLEWANGSCQYGKEVKLRKIYGPLQWEQYSRLGRNEFRYLLLKILPINDKANRNFNS